MFSKVNLCEFALDNCLCLDTYLRGGLCLRGHSPRLADQEHQCSQEYADK